MNAVFDGFEAERDFSERSVTCERTGREDLARWQEECADLGGFGLDSGVAVCGDGDS